ncbi:MAG: UDP-N-acetylglucosamine 1-carboxyvinyltransferase, partial [Gammaproteobacteria bacterium]|nr:UDP-N-acetylglucosamine 1-carboxyvinyltransferase [Gammaproteobacteria bacterium]
SGAKNAALPLMAAAILADGPCVIHGVPKLRDIVTFKRLLGQMGVQCDGNGDLRIDASGLNVTEAPYELVKTMRASALVLGPLLAKNGKARVSLPGGCAIGARPVDIHLKALSALGANIELVHGYIEASTKGLHGAEIILDIPSVGATENILMAAVLAEGRTIVKNPAREPEICALADFLRKMGANIEGDGTDYICINGVETLHGAEIDLVPDRIEAGTLMIAVGMTKGNVLLKNCRLDHLAALIG